MNKISSKHYLIFILSVIMISIRSYSSIFIELGGRDTWLISAIATLIISIFMFTLLKICINTNTFDIKVIFYKSLKGTLGKIFIFIFSVGLFLITIEAACVETSSIHSNYFLSTPVWYCLIFFIATTGYICTKKFKSILITITVIVFVTIIGDIVILALVIKYLDLNNLLPVLKDGLMQDKLLCLLLIIGSLSSVCISLPYLKFLDKKRDLIFNTFFALLICGFFISTSFASLIALFGPIRSGNIFYPEYLECQRIKISGFIEFGELFFIFRSVCMWCLKYILSLYGIIVLYENKIKNKTNFIIIYSIVIFILSNFITQNQYFLFSKLKLLNIILFIPFVFIPLISFGLYYLKKVKNNY